MKKGNIIMNILFIGLIILCGCTKKNVEGVVISVPASMSFEDLTAGKISDMTFTGDVVKVRLNNGEEVDALATREQMEQAFEGKNKATLEKTKDEAYEGIEWKIVKLEENQEQQEQ